MTPRRASAAGIFVTLLASGPALHAQGVTSGSIAGVVVDPQDRPVPGAIVAASHEAAGTRSEAATRADGRFAIPGLRPGGPYRVVATFPGLQPATYSGVRVGLGVTTDLVLRLGTVAARDEVTVTASAPGVLSSARTGAATSVARDALATLPTIGDRINDFARLTPQYAGPVAVGAYAGADVRSNNITIDGSYFNTFGLTAQPGDGTEVAPIATEALEEIQVSVAPYDVRQGHFVGAAVNAVTRSGTNDVRGSAYYRFRDDRLVGREARGLAVDPGSFEFDRWGAWLSGPLIRDRLSFFASWEDERLTAPGTTFRARAVDEVAQGNTTRVRASDLDALADYLRARFDYDPGPYQGYVHETPARRYLARLDASPGGRDRVSLRYLQLDSTSDALVSNASAFGPRRGTSALAFRNSNYRAREDIRSAVAEWRSVGAGMRANTLLAGYTWQDQSRARRGSLFPTVDILEGGAVYTTFGTEPFTPGNELRYRTFQVQDTFTWTWGSHLLAAGGTAERFASESGFAPSLHGHYVYSSLVDFFADAEDYLAHPDRTSSPVTLRRFQVRWANVPGREPAQRLRAWYTGAYVQDEWQVRPRLKLTGGLRADVPFFGSTGLRNPEADALAFRGPDGEPLAVRTGELPRANVLWSPRVGFNWAADDARRTQVRGGTGLFTGPPPWVWISAQTGTTGVLTGAEVVDNTRLRGFDPDPEAHKPAVVAGAPAPLYDLAVVDPGFRFPQVWRTNLALDRALPGGLLGTLEGIHTREVNGSQFVNVNLPAAQALLAGPDDRPRWTANRIHPHVTTAIVLVNQDEGDAWSVAASLARSWRDGFLRASWAAADSRTPAEPGGTALSWAANPHAGDPNDPGSQYFSRSRRLVAAGAHRVRYRRFGATTVSFFFEGRNEGRASYTYAGDLNGDGGAANDLLYVPRDVSEMNFEPWTSAGRTFTAEEQAAAWQAYIEQDPYLRGRRGRYAQRNALVLPMVWRLDVGIAQDLFRGSGRRVHGLQLRADILNVMNLIDADRGVARRLVSPQPLTNARPDPQGRPVYRLRAVNGELISRSFEPTATLADVYRVQFSLRYSFN